MYVICSVGLSAFYTFGSIWSLQVAVGYADGSIRIWDLDKGTCETTLNGHKGAVTALRYNNNGSLLASGSKDNDIILWDVVAETGLYRLRGHCDQVVVCTSFEISLNFLALIWFVRFLIFCNFPLILDVRL